MDWRRLIPVTLRWSSDRTVLRELHYTGEVAAVAREEFDGGAFHIPGAPTNLCTMRNTVDSGVETLTAIIRNNKAASRVSPTT